MKIFKIFPAFLALLLLFSMAAPASLALDAPALTAKAVLLADLDSGCTLYALNADASRSPASLTKIMTVLLALEAVEKGEATLDDRVTAGQDCRNGMRDDSSSVYIVPGETMSLRDLIYCAAVSSGNDACNVIASYLGGGIPNFVNRMNYRAAQLGCENTRFVDPNGLSYDNLTTAYDLYRITLAAMEHPAFMEICDTVSCTVAATNVSNARKLQNSNALICSSGPYGPGYYYEGAHGVKTGYTRAAGYCLISTAERDGMRLLAIVLGSDGPYLSDTETRYNFVDTVRLYDWAFAGFSPRTVFPEGELLGHASLFLSGGDGLVELRSVRELRMLLPNDLPPGEEEITLTLYEPLVAPVAAGTVLGEAALVYRGAVLGSVPLAAAEDVPLALPFSLQKLLSDYMTRIWSTT